MIQWLRLLAPNAGGERLILGQGTKIPHAVRHGKKLKKIKIKMSSKVHSEVSRGNPV